MANAGHKALVQLGPTTFVTITGLKTAEITVGADVYDITDLNNNLWKLKLGGLADYSLKLGGNYDLTDAKQTALQGAIIVTPGTMISWKILPTGTGGAAYAGSAIVKGLGVKIAVNSEEQVTFDLDGSGALTYS